MWKFLRTIQCKASGVSALVGRMSVRFEQFELPKPTLLYDPYTFDIVVCDHDPKTDRLG